VAQDLVELLAAQEDAIVEACVPLVLASSEHFAAVDPASVAVTSRQLLRLIGDLHQDPNNPVARAAVWELCELRVPSGFGLGEVMAGLFIYNEVVLPRIRANFAPDQARIAEVVDQFRAGVERLVTFWAEGFCRLHEQMLDRKEQAMRQLSTPVLQIWDGVLALPLIGDVDDQRSRQITEELLTAVIRTQSDIVLVDITGLGDINTNVIAQLLRTVKAAELLGAEVWIVGIAPEIAQTIVSLGVDLQRIKTYDTLRQGLAEAFTRHRLHVEDTPL